MKLATFTKGNHTYVGALDGSELVVIDVPDMRTLFELGHPVAKEAEKRMTNKRFKLEEVKLNAPIAPKKIFHTAGNFREHAEEGDNANWGHAIKPWIVFFQNVDAIIGDGDDIVYPQHLTKELDYELEFCVVMGKPGKFISVEDAMEYVGGYVIFNDITARDIQRREMDSDNFSFSKSIDTFCPLGPWIVTADEITDPYNLNMQLRVNGEVRQISNTGRMSVTLNQIISKFSPASYSPGDIVTTGTVSGVAAFSADPQAWYLKPGDVIEAEVEKIGVLHNKVVSWKDAHGVDAPEFEGF